MSGFELHPIGYVRGGQSQAIDDDWGNSEAVIELDQDRFIDEAMMGLGGFSHVDVVFLFDKVPDEKIESGARH